MADEPSLNFKYSLDLSDFDKAPEKLDEALRTIARQAEVNSKNADMAMSEYLQAFIRDREQKLKELQKALDDATLSYAEMNAKFRSGEASYEEWKQAFDTLEELRDKIREVKDELVVLNEKEDEVAGNASFLTQLKMKAQGMDLYGKAMSMLPAPIASVIQSTKGLNKALLALTTNPIVMMLAGLAVAIKGLYGWFDGLADRSDGVAYAFGVVTGAVDKAISAFNELIHLNVEGFLYNIKTMFDGGEREVAKRNEDLRRVEEEGLRDRLQRDNQFLRRRMNNTKLDMKDRLEAEKQYTENLKKIEETRRAELERKMTEWSKQHGLKTKDNPEGWATDISQLSGPLQVELQQMYNEMARIDNAMEDITEESKDRLVKMRDQIHSEFEQNMKWLDEQAKAKRQYQRQVRDQLEQEKERLRTMALQTENAVIQSQINDMADGIEKVTKQAGLKAKQAMEALDRDIRAEAEKLYSNEKSLFEANPANEGKMFKRFKLDDYVAKAKQNIGYDLRTNLISDEEVRQVKKAIDDIVKHALDGAKKVSVEIGDTLRKVQQSTSQNAPSFADTYESFSLGINDVKKATEEYKSVTDDLATAENSLMELQMKRLGIMMELNHTEDGKKKVELAKELEKTDSDINDELSKSEDLLKKQASASEKVKSSFDKMKNNILTVASAFGNAFSSLKGISKEMDETAEALGQMTEMATNLLSGDVMGAVTQVASFIANKLVESIKAKKELEQKRLEREKEYAKEQMTIQNALIDSAFSYQIALLKAKDAQDALYNTTNINKMLEAQKKLTDVQEAYNKNIVNGVVYTKYGRMGDSQHYNLNQFVEQMTDRNQVISGSGTREDPYRHKKKNDIIKEIYGDYLFEKNGNGEYELNSKLWSELQSNNEAIKYFTESELNAIGKVYEYQQMIAEAQGELAQSMADWYSPLLDNMTDAWMNWLTTGENVMDSFKDYAGDSFRQIIKDQLKNNIYQQVFKPYVDSITEKTAYALKGGTLDDSFAETLAVETKDLMEKFENQSESYKKFLESYDEVLNNLGINIKEDSAGGRSAEARGIARASQESVDENNARLAMMQQHTYSINANVAQLVSFSASALEHLSAIHANTNRLERIEKSLSNIETYGIRVA